MAITLNEQELNRILGASLLNVEQRKALKEALSLVLSDVSEVTDNLNAWATALATKLNTDFTAQNAAVTGSQLDVDYDTDPQA